MPDKPIPAEVGRAAQAEAAGHRQRHGLLQEFLRHEQPGQCRPSLARTDLCVLVQQGGRVRCDLQHSSYQHVLLYHQEQVLVRLPRPGLYTNFTTELICY